MGRWRGPVQFTVVVVAVALAILLMFVAGRVVVSQSAFERRADALAQQELEDAEEQRRVILRQFIKAERASARREDRAIAILKVILERLGVPPGEIQELVNGGVVIVAPADMGGGTGGGGGNGGNGGGGGAGGGGDTGGEQPPPPPSPPAPSPEPSVCIPGTDICLPGF